MRAQTSRSSLQRSRSTAMDLRTCSLVLCALFAAATATDVQQCPGMSIPDLTERVHLTRCKKPPCTLKKGTRSHITLKFTPESDVSEISNHVIADVFGVPLPFVGVDGASICDKVFLADDPETKAPCPLKAGTNYIYKDSFPVLSFYPSLDVKIHWAIQAGNKDISCFEVNAKIA